MPESIGRSNQKRRTRKDLLKTAARLMRDGRKPTIEEVAEEALISRATAYRYFSGTEALLLEASLDIATPEAEIVLDGAPEQDALARILQVDEALRVMISANEVPLRMLVAQSLQNGLDGTPRDMPARQNRRSTLIEAALEPCRGQFDPATLDVLAKALAILIGTEAHIATADVLQIPPEEARAVTAWAIEALIDAARAT
jgi:AcrR family transcriptional regulator